MKATKEIKEALLKFDIDIDNYKNMQDLLLTLDELIANKGFNENDEINETGIKLTKIYDAIYSLN